MATTTIKAIKLPNGDTANITDKTSGYVATDATTSAHGLMSASDKTKLNGIASGAEVNQNAFSNVTVGTTTVTADSKTDTLTLEGGQNITLSPDATNDKIVILLDDTVTTGEVIATEVQAGDLVVSGASRFINTINGTASNSEKLNGQSLTSTYSSTGTAPITGTAVASAIGALDGTVTGSPSASKTLTAFSQTDGKVSATFGNILITKSQVSDFPTLGTAAAKNFTTSVTSGSADLVTSGAVWTAIDNLPEPMVFKGSVGTGGTVTDVPVDGTAKVGDTYKVITAGTYGGKTAKIGDTLICLTKTSSANTWELIPSGDEPSGTVTSVGISNGGGLSVSGSPITSSGTITISHADTSSQATTSNSGRTYIQNITLDTYGHVTGLSSATETVTNTDRYVNSAAFAHDSTNDNVKMTLTRAGSDTATVTANIPKVSSSSAGVVPKGATVSSQSQTTKFLREDGTWQVPSYTTNTNTTYTLGTSGNTVTLTPSSGSVQSITVPYATSAGTATDNTKVLKAGDTMTGNLIVPKTRIANTCYGISYGRTTNTPVETILYTGIKWVSGSHMPVVHITGYAYGLQSPVEFKIGFYIYGGNIGYCGATNMGSWNPDVYLFKYTRDSVDYVAVGLAGSCYFLQLQADVQDEMGKFGNISMDDANWSWDFLTTAGTIPTPDGGVTCIKVSYKADILYPPNAVKADKDSDGNIITSTYLKKSGGTMTGLLNAQANVYTDAYTGALNMQNSNIYGVNAIYTADTADGAGEGINFYRDSTHVDTLWMSGGDLLFVPNRVLGTNTTAANSQKVGRFTANPTSGQVVITDGTTGGMKSSGYTIAKSVPSNAVFTDTTYTLSADTTNKQIKLTPSSGSAQSVTVPYATKAEDLEVGEVVEDNKPYLYRQSLDGDAVSFQLVGGTIAWNQLVQNGNFANGTDGWTKGNALAEDSISVSDGVLTATSTNGGQFFGVKATPSNAKVVSGHKYVAFMTAKASETLIVYNIYADSILTRLGDTTLSLGTSWTNIIALFSCNTTGASNIGLRKYTGNLNHEASLYIRNVNLIDLTQAFGSTIADAVYTMEQSTAGSGIAWLKSYGFLTKLYYANQSGKLESVNVSSRKVVGFNIFNKDATWTSAGNYIINDNGQQVTDNSSSYYLEPIRVIPNTQYYINGTVSGNGIQRIYFFDANGNFISRTPVISSSVYQLQTTPLNCHYIKIQYEKSLINTSTWCINISDTSKNGTYEPYTSTTYGLSGEHEVKRKFGIVDLGSLNWTYDGNFHSTTMQNAKDGTRVTMCICPKYESKQNSEAYVSSWDKVVYFVSKSITVRDSAYTDAATFKQAMNGVYLVYELATPTTETVSNPELRGVLKLDANNNLYYYGDTMSDIPNPQLVYTGGTEEYVDAGVTASTPTRDVAIPVGNISKYQTLPDFMTTDVMNGVFNTEYADYAATASKLVPTGSKKYESKSFYATSSGSWETSTWYFMSVKPDSWYKPWRVKFKVHSYCPGYANVDSITWAEYTGDAGTISYSNWNDRYDPAHYYLPYYPLKQAGFTAGYGHAIGISILYGTGYTTAADYRTFEVEYFECENCTVTLLDTPVKWADWAGTGTTNYGSLGAPNAVDRGLCETNDSNDGHYYARRIYSDIKAGSNKIFPYTVIMQNADGRWESLVTSSSTGTSKARNTHGFRLGQMLLMNANATYNENDVVGTYNTWEFYGSLIDHRYFFNTANDSTNGTTANKPIYIVGTLNATDGLFYLDTTWWTQTLPTSDNGKLYIYLGDAYDYYRTVYSSNHPIYWYKDGKVQQFSESANYAVSAGTATSATSATSATTATKLGSSNVGSATQPIYLNGGTATATTYTLGKSVPSDALFTDTKNTAGSTDTSSKIYLVGATSQAENPQTYSDDQVSVTNGVLSTNGHTSTGNIALSSSSGDSPQLQFLRGSSGSSLTKWRMYVSSGQLKFDSSTDGSTWTNRAYFADNSGALSLASVSATGALSAGTTITAGTSITAGSTVSAASGVNCNTANSGTAGGLALYSTDPTSYGIADRNTSSMGKFGYVQGDWAEYHFVSGATNRGWIYKQAGTAVTSISGEGHISAAGSLTLGANATNTSGVRQVYNSTTKSLDFVFV